MGNRIEKKIEIQQTAFRILELLVNYQRRTEAGSFSDGLNWSTKMIAHHLNVDEPACSVALLWLLKQGWIEQRRREWFKTQSGIDAFQEESRSVRLMNGPDVLAWKNEVLTGMNKDGEPTRIKRAALPSPTATPSHFGENRDEDEAISVSSQVGIVRGIARELNMSPVDAAEGLRTGRVRRCKGVNGVEHWGIFHRKGTGWQSLCIQCRKLMRKRHLNT